MERVKNGILILVSGHFWYGRYAYSLAVTIKAVENFPIAVVHSGEALSHISEEMRSVFDYVIPATLDPNCGVKLHAYELSPFENTLVLDADMLWLPERKPSELFAEQTRDFECISEGDSDNPNKSYFFWAKIEEIRERYEVEKIHQLRSEVMFFRRTPEVEALFNDALKIFAAPGLVSVKKFGGGVPDELALNISCAIHRIEPSPGWQPSYWPRVHKDVFPSPEALYSGWYLVSVGGNMATDLMKKFYNNLLKAQARKIGQSDLFKLQSKYEVLKERKDA